MSCRIARAREWATRCLHEASQWEASAFLTLTYDDQHLPDFASLEPRHLVNFWKRLRHHVGPIKYYSAGEYGEEEGHRPHYHAIVFGLEPCRCGRVHRDPRGLIKPCGCPSRQAILKAWTAGSVDRLGTVTYQSARYVAEYITKKLTGELEAEDYWKQGRYPPFAYMSKGIGRRFAEQNAQQLTETLELTVNGVQVGLPRYYTSILKENFWRPNGITSWKLLRKALDEGRTSDLHTWTTLHPDLVRSLDNAQRRRHQQNLNLLARARNFKKGSL